MSSSSKLYSLSKRDALERGVRLLAPPAGEIAEEIADFDAYFAECAKFVEGLWVLLRLRQRREKQGALCCSPAAEACRSSEGRGTCE